MLLDTHCHLSHEQYRTDLRDVLVRAHAAGVGGVVAIASDLKDAIQIAGIIENPPPPAEGDGEEASSIGSSHSVDPSHHRALPRIWGTSGIHPHEASQAPSNLEEVLTESLTTLAGIVAIGECGLDFHYDLSPRAVQRKVFRVHLQVAEALGLPLVVHCREAEEEMKGWIEDAGSAGVRGVLHCFPGDLALMEVAMEAGWLVSFTGLVTFRSFAGVDAVREVPEGRYMLETDGPYMAPVPHRGRRNEPAFVPRIRDRVAELRGMEPGEIEAETTETARAFFRLSD